MTVQSPYYSIEAEMSILGAAIQDAHCVKMVAECPDEDIYDNRHKLIRDAIAEMYQAQKPVDLVTLNTQLEINNRLDAIGGTGYLLDLIAYVPTTANVKAYLDIVQQCSMRRKLYNIGKQLMDLSGTAEQSPEEVREWAARAIKGVRMGRSVKLITMEDACMATYEKLEANQQSSDSGGSVRIMSGIPTLDNKLGGLQEGEYVAIGARPSVGKSILALTFCVNAAKQGKRTLLVSLEMNAVQITQRIFAAEAQVPMNAMTAGTMDEENWGSLARSMGKVSKLPLWYCMEASTVEKVRNAAYQLYENGGLDLIAIDYLQLMDATYSKRQSRQEQISEISRGLRILAQELGIPILVLTQLNRSSVKGQTRDGQKLKHEPTIDEARESGAIEQDANIFILLHDPGREEMRTDTEREVWDNLDRQGMAMMRLIVGKNRQGKRGRLTVAFDGDHMRFLPIIRRE